VKLITVKEFCTLLMIDGATECRWRKNGTIPKSLYFERRFKRKTFVRYIDERVEAWLLGSGEPRRKSMSRGNVAATQRDSNRQVVEHESENGDGRLTEHHADGSLERT
jgi:hypothetical protein